MNRSWAVYNLDSYFPNPASAALVTGAEGLTKQEMMLHEIKRMEDVFLNSK